MIPNGLWIVMKEMPHADLVGISLHIKGGARCDSEKSLGIAHFLEHVFFRGTEKYPDRETLNALVEADGGYWNAMTSHEKICCLTCVFPESVEKSFDAISQMVFHPLFREEDINIERGAVLGEIDRSTDDPENCAHELYRQLAWGEHPVGRDILGTPEHVGRAARIDFLEYFEKCFYPGNMVLSVAGGISSEDVFELCLKYFYDGDANSRVRFAGEIFPSAKRIEMTEKDVTQVHAVLGTKALNWLSNGKDQKKTVPAMLLLDILGGSTRLFKKVRDEMGLVYTIYSSASVFTDGGSAYTYFAAEPVKALTSLKITLDEYENVLKNGVTEEELRRAKLSLKRRYAERKEKSLSVAVANGGSEILTGETLENDVEFKKYVEPVTLEDLRSVAPELLNKENLFLALAGKIGDKAKEFEDILIS
ncbi:hypothetical protein A2W54_00120 [Candidatus Giovannonibacteria bacterium RIFCSPHIGHO2_02_43_13]|uniref:Peptidase M16 n=1 Tax=Candidatus Giovannonibacteria bacterium RIFCSPHIGHO2_02_43_13 TaxID=1798330 RepID=A0A1F5WTJ2_9BACT|nr:MAG: Peptidase M16 domain protein [Parcubacteria group bacterium GW2011_GWA2_44_13]OGF74299.1 MAG: hypothetical protein A3E06_02220 [Candidatus Giovannonibacteria bacterium RIFCSPHIGHO2_12_FULL_44_42]OGF78601.1 MAG: hypothetical protein A2W54_00120 [Candidatus Giovannonibacteria bacterium RIFCSPHIGHO2_02_43_13]OGF89134.1 MAG: hypothetical protein A3I94_00495 [Candidatus Giovannonibacteria bacterium RIFCSPLOWO2_02_FULL_43_54]